MVLSSIVWYMWGNEAVWMATLLFCEAATVPVGVHKGKCESYTVQLYAAQHA